MNPLTRLVVLCLPYVLPSIAHAVVGGGTPPPPPPPSYTCVWYADDAALHQIRTDTNQTVVSPVVAKTRALAMNADDCGAWALDGKTLFQYDAMGKPLQQIAVASLDLTLDDAHQLALDPYDKSLWLADEKRLVHLTGQGQVLAAWNARDEIRQLALGLDQSVWLLGESRIRHYSPSGNLIATYSLPEQLEDAPTRFVVDSVRNRLWIAGRNRLIGLDISADWQAPVVLPRQNDITALTLNLQTGEVWIATKPHLASFDPSGNPLNNIDLAALNLTPIRRLTYDPDTQSLWAASANTLTRFTAGGAYAATLATADGDDALAAPALMVIPKLSLVQPPNNALTNNPTPTFTVGYDALCNGQPCGFALDYFSRYVLNATLNSQAVGALFAYSNGQASYTPTARLPEGQNLFNAQAIDGFGHLSNSVGSSFTLDTTPPKFVSITPADNSVLSNPNITLQGSVDDPAASVILANLQSWYGTGANPATQNFSWALTLNQGLNVLNLSAVDQAGNVATYALHLTYTPPPVTLSIASPQSGATVASDNITVSGAFTGPPNTGITVNGQVAGISGNQYSVTVPLTPGNNTLTAIATGPDGASATQSLSITSTGPAPISVTANPTRGLAPLQVSFSINNRTSNAIARIEADFDGNGSIDLTATDPAKVSVTYGVPGVYQAKVIVTDSQGNAYQSTQVITVQDAAGLGGTLRGIYTNMLANLRAGKIDAALTAVTGSSYQKYQGIFTALQSNLPAVVDQLGTLQNVTLGSDIAEYVLVRNTPNGAQAFLIYFLLGEDGVWRIDGM